MEFVKGQKIKLSQIISDMSFTLKCDLNIVNGNEIDICCFGIDKDEKLSDDRYFIFYNQLESPEKAITKDNGSNTFHIDLQRLPNTIKKIIIAVSIDGNMTMKDLGNSSLLLLKNNIKIAEYKFDGKYYSSEKSIVLSEIYIKDSIWRMGIVASGFNGGLGDILRRYGGEEIFEDENTNQAEITNINNNQSNNTVNYLPTQEDIDKKVYLKKKEKVEKLILEKAPKLIDLTKKVAITLEKKKIENVVASVVVVLDRSGSMNWQYQNGDVQRAMEKLLPIALMFDDDKELDTWVFAGTAKNLSKITLDNISEYVENEASGWRWWNVGYTNNEPYVMKKIIDQYKKSKLPVYVIFISDGGIYKERAIKKLMISSSCYPIFWQFVGIGGMDYGILEELDEMEGRLVDNANFFSIDNINSLSDENLYDKLLNEFPIWIREAKAKNILR